MALRLLGIDFGAARTGLALSDPLGITCSPLEIVHERDQERLVRRIQQVVTDNEVTELVVGHPRPLGGGTNTQQRAAEEFAERLSVQIGLPVHLWDERFTSKLAERTYTAQRASGSLRGAAPPEDDRRRPLRQARPPRSVGPSARDAVAACYVLQGYLDARGHDRERKGPS